MIPFYGFQAVGGKIFSLDDPAVVKDSAALDGTGGTAFVPFYVTNSLRLGRLAAYYKLRRLVQQVAHTGAVTVRFTAIRDGGESTVISRTLGVGEAPLMIVPLNDPGSDFQVKVEVTSYDAAVQFSGAEFYPVERRAFR
jgi:hypothetical protein